MPRFGAYLPAAGQEPARALELYEWNSQLAAAVLHDIGHFEVALRNAYDAAIQKTWRGQSHWVDDPTSPVRREEIRRMKGRDVDIHRRMRQKIDKVRSRLGPKAPPGKIIAELPFGFWRYMITRAEREVLWMSHLHHAYPPGTDLRDVDHQIGLLHELRNRAAHHEPLFNQPIEQRMTDLLHLAELLIPELPTLILGHSRVDELLKARP